MTAATPPADDTITLHINGESHTVPAQLTVEGLIEHLGKDPRLLAVERNRELVPRKQHADTVVDAGDRIEIVTLVGGG